VLLLRHEDLFDEPPAGGSFANLSLAGCPALRKFLQSLHWDDAASVDEAHRLLAAWRRPSPVQALELLQADDAHALADADVAGVLRGAKSTNEKDASKFGNPDSATLGTSGNAGERFNPETARATNLPERICGKTVGPAKKPHETCPPKISCTAGAGPLYGIWLI
jgi:hypothetical protein